MAGIVADYKVVQRGRVRLAVGADSDRTFEFDLPLATRDSSPTIVSYLLVSSNDLHMTIDIDGTLLSDRRYANGPERCIQEVADGQSSGTRKITFAVRQGEILFSDVVFWFQRDADDDGSVSGGLFQ